MSFRILHAGENSLNRNHARRNGCVSNRLIERHRKNTRWRRRDLLSNRTPLLLLKSLTAREAARSSCILACSMREASTIACNERIISTICAMVMAGAPSAVTGATGLERLLLVFLMKLSESQNAANNTYFSYDRLSDQSKKTPQENSRTPRTYKETCNDTRNHRFSYG